WRVEFRGGRRQPGQRFGPPIRLRCCVHRPTSVASLPIRPANHTGRCTGRYTFTVAAGTFCRKEGVRYRGAGLTCTCHRPASRRPAERERFIMGEATAERVRHNQLTEAYLAAFEASGLTASQFHAAVQPATVGTHFDGRCLTRAGFLQREQVARVS